MVLVAPAAVGVRLRGRGDHGGDIAAYAEVLDIALDPEVHDARLGAGRGPGIDRARRFVLIVAGAEELATRKEAMPGDHVGVHWAGVPMQSDFGSRCQAHQL